MATLGILWRLKTPADRKLTGAYLEPEIKESVVLKIQSSPQFLNHWHFCLSI